MYRLYRRCDRWCHVTFFFRRMPHEQKHRNDNRRILLVFCGRWRRSLRLQRRRNWSIPSFFFDTKRWCGSEVGSEKEAIEAVEAAVTAWRTHLWSKQRAQQQQKNESLTFCCFGPFCGLRDDVLFEVRIRPLYAQIHTVFFEVRIRPLCAQIHRHDAWWSVVSVCANKKCSAIASPMTWAISGFRWSGRTLGAFMKVDELWGNHHHMTTLCVWVGLGWLGFYASIHTVTSPYIDQPYSKSGLVGFLRFYSHCYITVHRPTIL